MIEYKYRVEVKTCDGCKIKLSPPLALVLSFFLAISVLRLRLRTFGCRSGEGGREARPD